MTENKTLVNIPELFLQRAKKQKRIIGIGIMRPIPETVESLKKASEYADLTVVGARVEGFKNIVEPDQDIASQKLIQLLKEEKVDGIVRGQVKDSFTLDEFHRQFGRKPLPSNRKVGPGVMHKGPYTFVVSTCSIYQGMTLEDKIYEVERIIKYMEEELNVKPKIGVMSTLRPTSKVGKYPSLDAAAEVNHQLAEHLKSKGYETKEYYFEYETAVWDGATLIIPSMGLVGNAWLKALLYLGDWTLISCQYLDLGVVYEEGTRNEKDFFWHVVSAVATANSR
jgi:predicted methyltransferase MtxX (methanogen marker protein 4)